MTKRTRIRIARRSLLPAMIVYVLLGFWPAIDSGNLALAFAFIIGECAFGMAHTWLPRKYDAEARATADGIWIGDRLIAKRNSMHSPHVRTARGGAWLRFERQFGWVDIALDAPGDERAWLAGLRMDAGGVVWRYLIAGERLESRAARTRLFLGMVLPIIGMIAMFAAVQVLLMTERPRGLAAVFAIAIGMLAVQLFAIGRELERVTIGADGLTLRRWIGRARFVPFASVTHFRMQERNILLTLRDGSEVAWHISRIATLAVMARHRAFVERINEGLAAHRALAAPVNAGQLARGSRHVAEWVRDLRAAADPDRARYRLPVLPSDELWKTVENSTAAPTARAGAAVALQRALDEGGRKRLRDVAATCASNDLRAALEAAVADEDIEARLEALAD